LAQENWLDAGRFKALPAVSERSDFDDHHGNSSAISIESKPMHAPEAIGCRRPRSFSHDLKTFFSSDTFENWLHNQKEGFSIGLPSIGDLPPLQIGADSSAGDIRTFQQRITNMSEDDLRSYGDFYFKRQVVNKEALEAWERCMDGHAATDIRGEVAADADSVNISLRWDRIGTDDKPPVIKAFYYQPLIPEEPFQLRTGSTIDTDGADQRFKRISTESVLLALSTTRGT
jgi:hypothetical protein